MQRRMHVCALHSVNAPVLYAGRGRRGRARPSTAAHVNLLLFLAVAAALGLQQHE